MKRNLTNLKEETLQEIGKIEPKQIAWAKIKIRDSENELTLPEDYTDEQLGEFIDKLDFEYDEDFGLQYVGGVIVFTDGSWLERAEYDGSEWWRYKKVPVFNDYTPEIY